MITSRHKCKSKNRISFPQAYSAVILMTSQLFRITNYIKHCCEVVKIMHFYLSFVTVIIDNGYLMEGKLVLLNSLPEAILYVYL